MKIAFIGQKGVPAAGGGIERYAEDLTTRLATLGHEVIAYTRPYYTDPKLKEYRGVRLVSLPSIRTKHLDAISHTFLATVDAMRRRFDVIHYQNIGPGLLAWLPRLFSRAAVVSTLQSRDYFHKKWNAFARFMLRSGELVMINFSHETVAVTDHMKKYIAAQYGTGAHFIPNGSNCLPPVKAKLIKAWGLGKENYIAYIGRLVRHKGVHFLIEAYRRINPGYKLVIVGSGSFSGDYVESLMRQADGDPNILFLGNQTGDVLRELYANTFLFVLPSESEGLSLALLEAMSYNRPVLVSDIAENREGAGDVGYTFVSGDPYDLEKKLRYILSHKNEIRARGRRGRTRILEYYNWENIVRDLEAVYVTAANARKLRGQLWPKIWRRVFGQ